MLDDKLSNPVPANQNKAMYYIPGPGEVWCTRAGRLFGAVLPVIVYNTLDHNTPPVQRGFFSIAMIVLGLFAGRDFGKIAGQYIDSKRYKRTEHTRS